MIERAPSVIAKGKVARVHGGRPHFAEVHLSLEDDAGVVVEFRCSGAGWVRQGEIEEVSATGYEDWKAAADGAICHALAAANADGARVTVRAIFGMTTDTNSAIVALAAALAVWNALGVDPPADALAHLSDAAFSSWTS
jgi:hypothetical protein